MATNEPTDMLTLTYLSVKVSYKKWESNFLGRYDRTHRGRSIGQPPKSMRESTSKTVGPMIKIPEV